jgi:hypothetical protein
MYQFFLFFKYVRSRISPRSQENCPFPSLRAVGADPRSHPVRRCMQPPVQQAHRGQNARRTSSLISKIYTRKGEGKEDYELPCFRPVRNRRQNPSFSVIFSGLPRCAKLSVLYVSLSAGKDGMTGKREGWRRGKCLVNVIFFAFPRSLSKHPTRGCDSGIRTGRPCANRKFPPTVPAGPSAYAEGLRSSEGVA